MAAPMLAAFGSAIQKIGSAAMNATSTLSQFGAALTSALTGPLDIIKGMASALTPLVQLANPTAVWAFTRALDNFQAVIGQGVTPVLQGLTIYLTQAGNAWARLMPVLQPLFNTMGQLFANIAMGAARVVEAMAPFIEILVDVLVVGLEEASKVIAFFQGVMSELLKTLAAAFGLGKGRFEGNRLQAGAAVYSPQVSGVEEFARKQFEQSLMGINANRGGGKRPEEHLPDIAAAIKEGQAVVIKIRDDVENIWKWFQRNKEGIDEGLKQGGETFDKVFPLLGAARKALIT